jgi:parallel beta-helix repeat protein
MNTMKKIPLMILGAAMTAATTGVFAAPIPVTYLPFHITAPGTYVVTANLSYPAQPTNQNTNAAITISTSIPGAVILDLKGHTLTGGGFYSLAVGIGIFDGSTKANTHSITIQNGTVQNFGYGVWAEISGVILTNITVNSIAFHISQTPNDTSTGILFSQVSSSTISNCTFFSADNGITDRASTGGNTYSNNTFNLGGGNCLLVSGQNNGPEVLTNCHFGGPTK